MTAFVLAAAVATVLALALLLRPLWWNAKAAPTSHHQLNTAIYREELARLEQDLANGTLAPQDHAQARTELQRRMLDESTEQDAASTLRSPKRTLAAVALVVPLAAVAFYVGLGNPDSMGPDHAVQAGTQEEVKRMVEGLARKLETEPDNLKGWALLARSYKVMGRSAEAEIAFERAGNFIDNDAQMLANYADVAAANAGGSLRGKPTQLIDKALKADPENAMALWLAGTAALERKDYDKALRTWQHLAPQLPPGSEDAQMLQGAIDEVMAKMGKGMAQASAPAGNVANVATAAAVAAPAKSAGASVSGTIELDASLKAKASPADTVMVIARAPGTRMPLAVLRVRAEQLPLKFTLDDSLSMSPQALLSAAKEVEVEARISKSGMAKPEPGDLMSAVQTVKVGASGVALRVARIRQ